MIFINEEENSELQRLIEDMVNTKNGIGIGE
jgi:hypothetical protein